MPTLYPKEIIDKIPSVLPNITNARKSPFPRVFQADQIHSKAYNDLKIKTLADVNEDLLKCLQGYQYIKYDDHVVYYKMETNDLSIPAVTESIRVDEKLHVKLYRKEILIPLPSWFREGTNSTLKSVTQLENFPAYIRCIEDDFPSVIADELREIRFKKKPLYSASLIRYALLLRYTSLPAYRMLLEQFNLPSLSLLKKLKQGNIDAEKCAKILRENGKISNEIILIFDEMFLQRSQEFVGGNLIGCDENGELYKGILSFMIVGLKTNIPYVIRAVPEVDIKSEWLAQEIEKTLRLLLATGFTVSKYF